MSERSLGWLCASSFSISDGCSEAIPYENIEGSFLFSEVGIFVRVGEGVSGSDGDEDRVAITVGNIDGVDDSVEGLVLGNVVGGFDLVRDGFVDFTVVGKGVVSSDGDEDGVADSTTEGNIDGDEDGFLEGINDDNIVGCLVGNDDGITEVVGLIVGTEDGTVLNTKVGPEVGLIDGRRLVDGLVEGMKEGTEDGAEDGTLIF